MTKKEALLGSIKKWENIRDGLAKDNGLKDCPLCQLYYLPPEKDPEYLRCKKCPIFIDTGMNLCQGSPYYNWFYKEQNPVGAQKMIDYLKYLLKMKPITHIKNTYESFDHKK